MTSFDTLQHLAERLRLAERSVTAIAPLSSAFEPNDIASAYAVQAINVKHGVDHGRRLVGRKVGLTSKAIQQQFGVDQPDYGALFTDMEVEHDGQLSRAALIQPRIETEVALVLGRDIEHPDVGMAELMRSVAFVLPAMEIVDSRIADWKINILDTIADNGSSARYVLGLTPRLLTDLDLETCGMQMTCNGTTVSLGAGAACLGHPLKAALWLARTMAANSTPLRAGDLVLSGALGVAAPARAGETYEGRISGLGSVKVHFT